MASDRPIEPSIALVMANMGYALNVIAYVPLAVMLTAVAAVTVRAAAFPRWIAWLSGAAALSLLIMSVGIAVDEGPLAEGAWPTFIPYGLTAAWLPATSILLTRRAAQRPVSVPEVEARGEERRIPAVSGV